MTELCCDSEFESIVPATTLDEIWNVFEPSLILDPTSDFYIQRSDAKLNSLTFKLKKSPSDVHAFLCGHRGSGKTTELSRLCHDQQIQDKYVTVFLTARDFGSELVHLTHDALLVEIGLAVARTKKISAALVEELNRWGREIVTSYLKDEALKAEVGAKGAWLAFFKADLSTRTEWKREEKLKLEPRVQDLVGILNRMAQELKNATQKKLLVIIDDLEKGESDADKAMHNRLFQENYDTLVQPRFSIIYTLPVYFRGLSSSRRIPNDELFAFSAVRLYEREDKGADRPPLSTDKEGYILMRSFVEKRVQDPDAFFAEGVLDELLRIGGGLFRETARAIHEAAYFAQMRGGSQIEMEDVRKVFDQVKKEYQPLIRGNAIKILKEVQSSAQGWVDGIEPFLQSRAVVEYENGDLWLDLRHVLKEYVSSLQAPA